MTSNIKSFSQCLLQVGATKVDNSPTYFLFGHDSTGQQNRRGTVLFSQNLAISGCLKHTHDPLRFLFLAGA